MKNSPHRQKHEMKKAIRRANKQPLPSNEGPKYTLETSSLSRFDKAKGKRILDLYKKNLEIAIFTKTHKKYKFTANQLDGSRPFTHPDVTDKKAEKHWLQHDLAKSRDVARKILKSSYKEHKKAA